MALDCEFAIGTARERPSCGAEFLRLTRTFFVFLRVLTLCPDWSEYCDLLLVARLFEVVVTGAIACRFISCGTRVCHHKRLKNFKLMYTQLNEPHFFEYWALLFIFCRSWVPILQQSYVYKDSVLLFLDPQLYLKICRDCFLPHPVSQYHLT